MKEKITLTKIININFGSLGIQFAWALAIANITGIYAFFNASKDNIAFLWLALPLTGFIVQPVMGMLSDKTQTRYGKRLPYIFFGALVTAISMIFLPISGSLFLAGVLLWIFTAAINTSLQPFRALVADIVPEKQHTQVYAIQACLIGIGAVFASLLPKILLVIFGGHLLSKGDVPYEIKFAFYIGAVVLITTNLWTLFTTKDLAQRAQEAIFSKATEHKNVKDFLVSLLHLTKVFKQVSLVQFFAWMGVFSFIVYFTYALGQNFFSLPAVSQTMNPSGYKVLLEKSVILTGECVGIYMFASVIFTACIPYLSRKFSRKNIHIFSLLLGGISLLLVKYIHNELLLFLAMGGVGVAWGSLNSIPFAMVAHAIPENEMGFLMGIFNIAVCLPQIIVALFLGYLLKTVFHNNAADIMVLAGSFFIIASVLTVFVKD